MPRSDDSSDDSSPLSDLSSIGLETPGHVDSIFVCLADRRRRLLLARLSENSPPVVVEDLVQHIRGREAGETPDTSSDEEPVEITIALVHNHLPKLSEAGVIDVDRETNTVEKGDRFEAAKRLLQVV